MPSIVAMGSGTMFSERKINGTFLSQILIEQWNWSTEISILQNSTFKQLAQTFFWHPPNHRMQMTLPVRSGREPAPPFKPGTTHPTQEGPASERILVTKLP